MNIQQAELTDARRGTLYFLGKLDVVNNPSFDLGLMGNFISGTLIVSDLTNASKQVLSSCAVGQSLIDGVNQFIKPIKDLMASFFEAIVQRVNTLYGHTLGVAEWVGEFIGWAISSFVGSLADLIPGWGYVQSAADLYDGVKQSVMSAIKWLTQVHSGWGVKLLEGGPSIMAQAIARHHATQLAGGLKDIAIESTKVGLQAAGDAAAGAGTIVGAVTGVLKRIANMLEYCIQRYLLNKATREAAYHYKNKGLLVDNHAYFTEWFKKTCVMSPVIAALVINSGYTAHPYRFLSMISTDDEIINQEKFDKGIVHIEKLKSLSIDYIKEYQGSYKLLFRSDNPVVQSRIEYMTK